MSAVPRPHRGTIPLEDAVVLGQDCWAGGQYVLRLRAPKCATRAAPGSFVHLTCGDGIPMRRPLSIMLTDAEAGWIDILYKVVGQGLAALAKKRPGDVLSCLGPIGHGFVPRRARPRALLIGGGVGIPPMVFLARTLLDDATMAWRPLVLMGSEIPFPFDARPSTILVPGMPDGVIATMPLLDAWGVPARLASKAGFAGCHDGFVTDLAAEWLASLDAAARQEVAIYACGPTPMLRACAAVSRRFDVPCDVSLEEYMACAVGGCAGCAVQVSAAQGVAMKRVCVDGPVFDAATVFPSS